MFRLSYKTFILVPASILCMIVPFVYKAGFDNTQYFTQEAYTLPFILCSIALVISIFNGRYGSLAMFLSAFACLLSFVNASYLYLSSVFFSGIPDTLGAMLEQIGFNWSFCALSLLGAMLVGIVSMFLPDGGSI